MATAKAASSILHEIADLIASAPTGEQLLKYRPSKALQRRAHALLTKQNKGRPLTREEQQDLSEFMYAESLMGLLQAKLHAQKPTRP